MKNLAGKVALVTGGSRGIGAAIVRRLAKDGAKVALTYSKSAGPAEALVKEIVGAGGSAKAYLSDAGKPEAAEGLVAKIVGDLGGLDILVNNAGVFEAGASIGEVGYANYERVMKVNVDGVFAMTEAAAKVMKPGSRIINISSCLGERAAGAGMSVYVASKFAVTGFSRACARDLAAKGILVNAVQPGPINTDMNPENGDAAAGMRAQIPLGRYGQPDEIAGVVAFLAGPDATFITGARLNVDGGYNA